MSSMPQHAVANGIGHSDERRAQLMTRCNCVVRNPSTGIAASRPMECKPSCRCQRSVGRPDQSLGGSLVLFGRAFLGPGEPNSHSSSLPDSWYGSETLYCSAPKPFALTTR